MSALGPDQHRRFVAALRLLDSDKPGERDAALLAAKRLLPEGVSIADVFERASSSRPVAAVEPLPWRGTAKRLLDRHFVLLNEAERNFLLNISWRRREPTGKQAAWLDRLAAEFGEPA